jgi:transposase
VALVSVIRRWHLREGVSIREIARRTQLSRNTIRKYLADGTLSTIPVPRPDPARISVRILMPGRKWPDRA